MAAGKPSPASVRLHYELTAHPVGAKLTLLRNTWAAMKLSVHITATLLVSVLFAAFLSTLPARAQSPLVTIDTVFVGDAGNAAYTNLYALGSVPYNFAIGKYEVTIAQYTTFLNSVAKSDPYGLYSANMSGSPQYPQIAGISRFLRIPGGYTYSVVTNFGGSANRPITVVNWFDAARFANWMHNGATNGASTETGAYTLNGATNGYIPRNTNATWWVPNQNEWFKAAYYKGGGTNAGYWLYPTQSDIAPGNSNSLAPNQANYKIDGIFALSQTNVFPSTNALTDVGFYSNSPSAYGTFDQAGSLAEWADDPAGSSSAYVMGSDWSSIAGIMSADYPGGSLPNNYGDNVTLGFRLATVPEPSTYALLALSAAGLGGYVLRRRRK